MAAPYDLNDDGVVVITGTGAGGGTLANQLAQKGIGVVALEAGGRQAPEDFVNDEWASFPQLAWTDMRTTSGSWQVSKDFPNLPAWIVKSVGGTTQHWAGASLPLPGARVPGADRVRPVPGAYLLDWPLTLDVIRSSLSVIPPMKVLPSQGLNHRDVGCSVDDNLHRRPLRALTGLARQGSAEIAPKCGADRQAHIDGTRKCARTRQSIPTTSS